MAKYRRKKRRTTLAAPQSYAAAKRTAQPIRRSADEIAGMRRSRQRKGFGAFLRRNIRFIAIGGFVIVLGVIALFIFVIGKDTVPASDVADVVETDEDAQTEQADAADVQQTSDASVEVGEFDEESEYAIENVDEATLSGLTGSDDSLFSDEDEEIADAVFAAEGIRIGVTIGELDSDNDTILLSKLENAASLAEAAKEAYEVYFYNADGDYNQQVQDVRSMIKNDVDVIIVGSTEKENFDMVTAMAASEGVPVVAYNAPSETSGYAINVEADQSAWGEAYGEFMAENLAEGEVIKILGSADSTIDSAREAAIDALLTENQTITVADTIYASWNANTAGEAMTAIIQEKGIVGGVITEEGMAQSILESFVAARTLPKVMCGDATAGFIKLWYTLKSEGVDITPETEGDEDNETEKIYFQAQEGELIACAQPAPVSIGAVAFEIAQKIAEGRTLKSEGITYTYAVEMFITDENLMDVYVMVKDQSDSYVVRDSASDATIEALFEAEQSS